jgi:hypothetical protein
MYEEATYCSLLDIGNWFDRLNPDLLNQSPTCSFKYQHLTVRYLSRLLASLRFANQSNQQLEGNFITNQS